MKLVVQIQILPGKDQIAFLLGTMRAMNAASCFASEIGFENKVYGQVSIHRLCYKTIRTKFNLPAQMAIRAISKAVDAFARDKNICHQFAPLGAVPLDDRLFRITNANVVSIATVHGRIKIPYVVGSYFAGGLMRKMGQANLVYRDDKFYLYISVEFPEEPPVKPEEWIGVDLGIVNLATTSTGKVYSGKQVERVRRRNATARKQYQRTGTKSAKRRLKKLSGKQQRFQAITNHTISKQIVAEAKARKAGIALENLKGIRDRLDTVSRQMRRRLGNWGFYQLLSFVTYKAKLNGVQVVTVDPRNTSRTCSKCLYCDKGNRKTQDSFKCLQCGFSANADLNAAWNLSRLGASVNRPQKSRAIA